MAAQSSITHEGQGVEHVAILRDHDNSTEVRVAVGYGFNVFSFKTPNPLRRNEAFDVLYAEPGFPRADLRATGNGMPILVPFPNRIAGGKFKYDGKTYSLPHNDHGINAIHGFAFDRPWRIIEETDWPGLIGEFELFRDSSFTEQHWPGNFRVRCEIMLLANQVVQKFTVSNLSKNRMPFGLGTHPYFRLVADTPGGLDRCGIIVDAGAHVELEKTIPTGKVIPTNADTRVALDFGADGLVGKAPTPIGSRTFDDVYTNLRRTGESTEDSYSFEHYVFDQRQCGMVMTWIAHDDEFPYAVVYIPPHRKAVCIEPYTCVTNAVNFGPTLGPEGPPTGLWHLQPGEERSAAISTYVQVFSKSESTEP